MDETQEKVVDFFSRHGKWILGLVALGVVIAGVYGLTAGYKSSKEYKAQEVFGPLERKYNEKRQEFLRAESQKNSKDEKSNPEEAKKLAVPASGDLEKDYGSLVSDFEKILQEHKGTQAARMSALYLSEVYLDYKKIEEALKALDSQIQISKNGEDLLALLLQHRKAALIAEKGQCPEARGVWESMVENAPDYLQNEMRLKIGQCFEQEGQVEKAKQVYKELSQMARDSQSSVSRDAEKYLRYLNFASPAAPVGKVTE
jgi:predicted negative regulator of RcsB-dependent stress response